jgi:sarcosine oxidase subunit beta
MSPEQTFDVIIAGAGSVGTPTAMYLAEAGLKVLVLEALPSCGQASNKHAIGGVRATHSDPSKIYLCEDSIQILSSWQETFGEDIEWRSGGYIFVA